MSEKITVDGSHTSRVEHGIRPPMAAAVTIPITLDGHPLIVYVCRSIFDDIDGNPISDFGLGQFAARVADAIEEAYE